MSSMSDEQYQDIARFRRSLRAYVKPADQVARRVGMTPAQYGLLVSIRGAAEAVAPSISWLAEELQIQPHSVTGLVQRAEDAGLVATYVDREDGRVRGVGLTDEGRRTLSRLFELHSDELDDARRQLLDDLRRVQRQAPTF
jgi:DNA-binding MarR family transcriptional regulator